VITTTRKPSSCTRRQLRRILNTLMPILEWPVVRRISKSLRKHSRIIIRYLLGEDEGIKVL